ncbi:hypothetical protein OROMI_019088 [Orobanche minor]
MGRPYAPARYFGCGEASHIFDSCPKPSVQRALLIEDPEQTLPETPPIYDEYNDVFPKDHCTGDTGPTLVLRRLVDARRRTQEFEVIEKINPNAYRLRLSSHIHTADVFNVKHLVPFPGDNSSIDETVASYSGRMMEMRPPWSLRKNGIVNVYLYFSGFVLLKKLSAVHNIFHVSLLRKYVHDPGHVINYTAVKVNKDFTYEEQPEVILDRSVWQLRNKENVFVKIQRRNHSKDEATWECEEKLQARYPNFFNRGI